MILKSALGKFQKYKKPTIEIHFHQTESWSLGCCHRTQVVVQSLFLPCGQNSLHISDSTITNICKDGLKAPGILKNIQRSTAYFTEF